MNKTRPSCGLVGCFWHRFSPVRHPVVNVLFVREFADIIASEFTQAEIARLEQIAATNG